MNDNWMVWLNDALGNRLKLLDEAISFGVVRNANEKGAFSITLPYSAELRSLIRLDGLVEFWRRSGSGMMRLELVGLARKFAYVQGEGEDVALVVSGPDQHELLERRIVAYNAGSSYTSKSGPADDVMKEVVDENFINATDSDRNWTLIALEDDQGLGAAVEMGFSRKNVLETLQKLAQASEQAGTPVYFRLAPIIGTTITFRFETRVDYLGHDRVTEGAPVVFGEELGNLENAQLVYDYTNEATVVYAAGAGEEDYRYVYELEDAGRTGASAWNRREKYQDARNLTKPEVQNKAKETLEKAKPEFSFSGDLLEGAGCVYGVDWEFGDWVSCRYCGEIFEGMVKAVSIGVDEEGVETIRARVEA